MPRTATATRTSQELQGHPEVQVSAALVLEGALEGGGVLERGLPALGTVAADGSGQMGGCREEGSCLVEWLVGGQGVEAGEQVVLGAGERETGVESTFGSLGEGEPDVAGCPLGREGSEEAGEVAGWRFAGGDRLETCRSALGEGGVDGGEIPVAGAGGVGEEAAGVAEAVEAVGEGVAVVDGGEDGPGPVEAELVVDAGDLAVAPLVGLDPGGALSGGGLDAGEVCSGVVESFLDGGELGGGFVSGPAEVPSFVPVGACLLYTSRCV